MPRTWLRVPDLVKAVIPNDWHSLDYWKDTSRCLQSAQNPTGIPAHKMLSFYLWPGPNHPLGPKWVLSPEPYALEHGIKISTTYLGYSIEHACALTDFVPVSSRPNQAWILAKLLNYLAPEMHGCQTTTMRRRTSPAWYLYALGAGLADRQTEPSPGLQLPAQHVNHGRMGNPEFMRQLAQSRVLVGIGNPIV
ncbi:hypothetical protein DFH06DRAFT_1101867 [Mycena polygramma]|nr:hypothetical protein DFH06DRAFT_1101867 [Mycena polygramma]